jgi:hypothetical protein
LGRWLGVSHRVGSDLCYWIVTDSGQVVSKTSVEHVTCNDYLNEDTKAKVKEFENKLGERLDEFNFILQGEKSTLSSPCKIKLNSSRRSPSLFSNSLTFAFVSSFK